MKQLIIYGSHYGSTRRYAERLSDRTGVPAIRYREASDLSGMARVVYLGGLYAGGVLGLKNTLRAIPATSRCRLMIVTVGLSDPGEPENRDHIRASVEKQIPAELLGRTELFHLRGAMDYRTLSAGHRAMMALLYRSIRNMPPQQRTAEDRALMETYGKRVDFTDFRALEPIIREMQRETI